MFKKIDLHMHTTISDGTDTLPEILEKVRAEGIELFSVTDHDAIRGGIEMPSLLGPGDPAFIRGIEFSCRDEGGKYHILGYGYDPQRPGIAEVVEEGHRFRMKKTRARVSFLEEEFGFRFPEEELDRLFAMDNPGKPHIANMMVRLGYAEDKDQAIKVFINKRRFGSEYVRPEQAIRGILASGGIPVLAHPIYGNGDDLILGEDMVRRLEYLLGFGLEGLEAYYSGFTEKLQNEVLGLADRYGLYVTAGSDYHGRNKMVPLGDHMLEDAGKGPEGIKRFIKDVSIIEAGE